MNAIAFVAARPQGLSLETRSRLRAEIELLRTTGQMAAAVETLERISDFIGMPQVAWTTDVARPAQEDMDRFVQQGWPEAFVTLWGEPGAATKLSFFSRCRFTHLPFVTSLTDAPRRRLAVRPLREERVAAEILRDIGVRSLLTVPVHLPRGQVAMLTWAGPRTPASVKAMLEEVYAELIAVAHFAMRLLQKAEPHPDASESGFCLTPRQWDCLRLTAQGFREADVARLMAIAPTTVRYHIDSAVEKLGASNRTHAVAIAAQLGLLGPIGV